MAIKISVVIPVYNAEKYLQKAVGSALEQEETGEVLLIEDGSPDGSLDVCIDLEKKYDRVKLFRHPNGLNRGAGATRNLGIKKAAHEWVAFLDADDYYLPGRFTITKKIIESDIAVDGVFEAIGMQFYDKAAKRQWLSRGREVFACMDRQLRPESLFDYLVRKDNRGRKNYIHLDGLVVKRSLFESSGHFFDILKLHQDTAMTIQLAAFGRLVAGKQSAPVAMRGIHAENRITRNENPHRTKVLMWKTLFEWAQEKKLKPNQRVLIYSQYIASSYNQHKHESAGLTGRMAPIYSILKNHPLLFFFAMIEFVRQRF